MRESCVSRVPSGPLALSVAYPLDSVTRHWRQHLSAFWVYRPALGFEAESRSRLPQAKILWPFGLSLVGDFSLPMSWTVHETLSTASNLRAEDCNGMSHRGNVYPWIRLRCSYEMELHGKTARIAEKKQNAELHHLTTSRILKQPRITLTCQRGVGQLSKA